MVLKETYQVRNKVLAADLLSNVLPVDQLVEPVQSDSFTEVVLNKNTGKLNFVCPM
jgi:hypothetical protein